MTEHEISILKNNGWYIDNLSGESKLIKHDTSNGFTCQIEISSSESLLSVVREVYHKFDEQRYVEDWQEWIRENPSCWHPKSELELSAREQRQAINKLLDSLLQLSA